MPTLLRAHRGLLRRRAAARRPTSRSTAPLTLFVSRHPVALLRAAAAGPRRRTRSARTTCAAVRARQRELGVREAFEWVAETTPSLAGAARGGRDWRSSAGAAARARSPPAGRRRRRREASRCVTLGADDSALTDAQARCSSRSQDAGTARRSAGRRSATWPRQRLGDLGFLRERIRDRAHRRSRVAEARAGGVRRARAPTSPSAT